MTRWSEEDLQRYQARVVSPTGRVSRKPTTITPRKKAPRYTAKREWFDGICFGSQRELARYKILKLRQAAREIEGLNVHPRYDLHSPGGKVLGYIELDFEYWNNIAQKRVYEDVKDPKKNSSTRTPIYRWKARHLLAEHGIEIQEVA